MLFCLQSAIETCSYRPWSQKSQGCLDVSCQITNRCKYRITAQQRNEGFTACGERRINEAQERKCEIMWRTKPAYCYSLDHLIRSILQGLVERFHYTFMLQKDFLRYFLPPLDLSTCFASSRGANFSLSHTYKHTEHSACVSFTSSPLWHLSACLCLS